MNWATTLLSSAQKTFCKLQRLAMRAYSEDLRTNDQCDRRFWGRAKDVGREGGRGTGLRTNGIPAGAAAGYKGPL